MCYLKLRAASHADVREEPQILYEELLGTTRWNRCCQQSPRTLRLHRVHVTERTGALDHRGVWDGTQT